MRSLKICCVAFFALSALILSEAMVHGTTPFVESGPVRQNCAVCHRLDPQGRLEVISATGWTRRAGWR
jgi:hypothetical protein